MTTIRDVAKKAGVSITTVSRALNGYSDVSEKTRTKIFKIAKELNYFPNKSAQVLVKKKNQSLAFILSGLHKDGGKDNIVFRLLAGLYDFAETVNYEVSLYTTSSAHQREKTYKQFCQEHNISGAILHGVKIGDPYMDELLNSDFPCVLIDHEVEGKNLSVITTDNVMAAKEGVKLLINYNHKNIALINGGKDAKVSELREKGYLLALNEAGIDVKDNYICYANFDEHLAEQKTKELINNNPEITAIFCASDIMAMGCIRAIEDLGKKVPENISVLGFDNIPFAEFHRPALATVNQDFYMMGYNGGEQLLKMINKKDYEKRIFIQHKILARETIDML